jgi:hypothetical protein
MDEVVCTLQSVSNIQKRRQHEMILFLLIAERNVIDYDVLGLHYLYIHRRADAAICLPERAALNKVPKARWLPNSSQINRMISGGKIGDMAAKPFQPLVICEVTKVKDFALEVIDLRAGLQTNALC